jgi:hypothetical protein
LATVEQQEEEKARIARRGETVKGSIGHVIAGCFALAAFAVALIAGLAGDNAAAAVLLRALMAMILGYPLGLVAGMICARAIDAGVQDARNRRDEPSETGPSGLPHAEPGSRASEQVISV